MSGNLDALQQHGFLMPPKNPPKGEGAKVDSSGHLQRLTKKVRGRIARILVPAWCPTAGNGSFLPVAGEDGNPDLFLSSYQVRDYHVKLVVGEFRATIVLTPKGSGSVALRTAGDARQAYASHLAEIFGTKARTNAEALLVERVSDFWLVRQRHRAGSVDPSVHMPWDWPESIEAALGAHGAWLAFSVDYNLSKKAESMPPGERGRASGSWFRSAGRAPAIRKQRSGAEKDRKTRTWNR